MSNCERCGSKVNIDEKRTDFKCSKCENIKFKRDALEPVVKKVRENFIEIKKLDIGSFVKNLYVYGSYAEQKALCCDVDFLVIFDRLKLEDYAEQKLKLFRLFIVDKLWSYLEHESAVFIGPKVIGLLEKADFWDFRTCEEYPDCLGCFDEDNEDGECQANDEGFYSELRKIGIHNICLLECNYDKKQIVPECLFNSKCPYLIFKGSVESYFTNEVSKKLKEQADVTFESSNLKVKVIHLGAANSIQDFQKGKEKLEFRFIKIE